VPQTQFQNNQLQFQNRNSGYIPQQQNYNNNFNYQNPNTNTYNNTNIGLNTNQQMNYGYSQPNYTQPVYNSGYGLQQSYQDPNMNLNSNVGLSGGNQNLVLDDDPSIIYYLII